MKNTGNGVATRGRGNAPHAAAALASCCLLSAALAVLVASPFGRTYMVAYAVDVADDSWQAEGGDSEKALYIVQMASSDTSVAYAARGGAGLLSTDGFSRGSLSLHSASVRSHAARLASVQVDAVEQAGIDPSAVVYSYTHSINAFAATLTKDEARALEDDSRIGSITPSRPIRKLTLRSPAFLRLPESLWSDVGGGMNAGEDIVIGVVDTGIWPENPAFSDVSSKPYGPKPAKFTGACRTDASSFTRCNNKVIGANFFSAGIIAAALSTGRVIDLSADYLSPRDVDGHGSHCASNAAGSANFTITSGGQTVGRGSGVAPRARLAAYKMFWTVRRRDGSREASAAEEADLLAAIDQAVKDGVDVLSLSLGGGDPSYFVSYTIGLLNAYRAGIIVAMAAGNDGPPASPWSAATVDNAAPWYLTVAASNLDTGFTSKVQLGDGTVLSGPSLRGGSNTFYQIVDAESIPAAGSSAASSKFCIPGSLSYAQAVGKIVLCLRGINTLVQKGQTVAAAGGAGIVLMNNASITSLPQSDFTIPGLHITYGDGLVAKSYIQRTTRPTAAIQAAVQSSDVEAPVIAYFSSQGPGADPAAATPSEGPSNSILKPDVAAPGVNIWAAWTSATFAQVSGTSMATPHVAGLAALMKQLYPSWGPSAIMSAIMTTAYQINNKGRYIGTDFGKIADGFAFGSGHVKPPLMDNPGVVFENNFQDMINFLTGINPTVTAAYFPSVPASPIAAQDLNLPNIIVSRLDKSATATRRVRNVSGQRLRLEAEIDPPLNVRVVVQPTVLVLEPGASALFTVKFNVLRVTSSFHFGSLVWRNGTFAVRSVLAAQPISI